MPHRSTWPAVCLFVLLAGCGHQAEKRAAKEQAQANAAVAKGFTPPPTMDAPKPSPGVTAYIGKYPSQQIDGILFFDRTAVHQAVEAAVPAVPIRRWIMDQAGPQTPIFRTADGRIASWGCEAHNCGDHNWTVFVNGDASKAEVCYHDQAATGDKSQWYAEGHAVLRAQSCPSGAQGQG